MSTFDETVLPRHSLLARRTECPTSTTADCNDIDPYAYHGHTPRYDCALIYGSESR
jgi:hypothetical protein